MNKLYEIAKNKAKLYIISLIGGTGCFTFALIGIIIIILSFTLLLFNFDLNIGGSNVNLDEMQQLNPRIQTIQNNIEKLEGHENVMIDGALIASTLQILTLYDPSLELESLDEKYDEELFVTSSSDFPNYQQLYEMAQGMIATKIVITCEEINPEENEEKNTYTTSYIEEMIGIDGYEIKICKSGYKETSSKKEYYFYPTVYEKKYLPTLFAEHFDLDLIEDKNKINSYVKDVMDMYIDYRLLIYNEDVFLEGIIYYDSDPLITKGGSALPINMGVPLYGAYLSSSFGLRTHPVTKEENVMHYGIDLSCGIYNPPIYATYDGIIVSAQDEGVRGLRVVIKHDLDDDGIYEVSTAYQHLSKYSVTTGISISAGDEIGLCGTSGMSTGNHLHFEIINNDAISKALCSNLRGSFAYDECYLNPEPKLTVIGKEVFSGKTITEKIGR